MRKLAIFLLGTAVILGGFAILLTCLSPEETETAPENRDGMAALAVVNKTGNQVIDSAHFNMGNKKYTMDTIGIHDRHYIVLEQGTWETRLNYTEKGITKTTYPLTSIIVPSNDPQIIQMHYLYFYLNKHGDYALSRTWPPFPNDADEQDILPPDAGYGRSLIKIVNNSYARVEMVTIHNLHGIDGLPLSYSYNQFTPSIPVQYNKTGYVEVTGTPEFPIEANEGYLIQITMESDKGIGIIERKEYIKDKVIMIIIAGGDFRVAE
jgi:hypothetical protein